MPSMPDSKRAQLIDERNADILVHVGGKLLPREDAKVSVFDSSVQGGDAVWEGLRIYSGRIMKLDAHLQRLVESARAMAFADIPDRDTIRKAIFETLEANGMRDEAHIRLTLTRGEKITSGMSPAYNRFGSCLIVLAEWKKPVYDAAGINLITSSVRRNAPQCLDSKIHHNNLINNILAKIEANAAGADDALMLDIHGFLAETNATNVFLVRNNQLVTPTTDSCVPGVTRATVIDLADSLGIDVHIRNVTPSESYAAAEFFTTGTMGELAPVLRIDGRTIGDGAVGPVTRRLQQAYRDLTARSGEPLPF